MLRRVCVCLLVISCSSSAPAPEPEKPSAPAPATPNITHSDRALVAQATLEVPELQQYFHNRKPLRVVVNRSVNPAWKLTFAGDAVAWVDETSDEPRIEFTLLRVEGDKAAATIEYDVEGIVMHAEFRRDGDAWSLADFDLAER